MSEEGEKKRKAETGPSGWRFWLLMIIAGLVGKFFGLVGGAIFIVVWMLIEWLWKKKR